MESIKHIIDLTSLRAGAKDLETRIRALKQSLRSPWTKPMGNEQNELQDLKREITAHYVLRALLRGRRHLSPSFERAMRKHLERAEKLAVKYRRESPPEEAAADELIARSKVSVVRQLWKRIEESSHAVG